MIPASPLHPRGMHPPFRGAEPCCTRRLSPLVRVRVPCFRCKETRVSSVFEETRVFSVFEETRVASVFEETRVPSVCRLQAALRCSHPLSLCRPFICLCLSVCLSFYLSACSVCVCVCASAGCEAAAAVGGGPGARLGAGGACLTVSESAPDSMQGSGPDPAAYPRQ